MPMQQLCGAGCDGQLRYGGSSRPSNILFPGLGCSSSSVHYMRTGGGSAPGDSSRPARYALGSGCGAFSASMAQLASPAQCSSRVKQLHAVVGGSSSNSHRLYSSSSTVYCSSPFHGPYAGHSALAVAGGLPRGPSQQFYGQCGLFNGGGGLAAATASLYCSSILGSGSSSRRGSCCNSVLPPQSHSHQIAKQLEQQQLEMEEAAAGARGHCVSQGHYQYHDFSKHHGGGESCYSHLFPEKLHDWVEVIKHPRSHSTQATPIALSSLHIGECPGVPENASSFAMKRTGTLKWQPGSILEEDDDSMSVSCNPNSCDRGDSSKNSSRSSSKSSNRTKSGKGSKNNNSKTNGNTGSNNLGLPTKARYHVSHQEPKNELARIIPPLGSPAGSTDGLAVKTDMTATGGSANGAYSNTVIPRRDEVVTESSLAVADVEKIRGSRKGRDMALSGLFTAAAVVGLPGGTRATTGGQGTADETRRASCVTVPGAEEESINKEIGRGKRKKTLGFRKRTSTVNARKPAGGARVQRCQKNIDAMQDGWGAAEATHYGAVVDGDRATTATGSSNSGNSSGSSGGESDNSGSAFMVSPPSYGSALNCLSGRESECSGSPRKHHPESAVDDASHADSCAPTAGTGGPETLKKNFSWHKLRQKLKL